MAKTKVSLHRDARKQRQWTVRWFGDYDPITDAQRRYSKSFVRKGDAESFRAEKQAEFDKGSRRDRPDEVTLGDFCDRFGETCLANHSHSDQSCYGNTISQLKDYFGASAPLRRIDRQRAEQFMATRVRVDRKHKGKPLSSWSRAQHLKHCRAMWKKAVEWEYVPVNIFDRIRTGAKTTKPWHHITPEEFHKIIAKAPNVRWRAAYWLLYGCGLRFGEAYNLLWSDIDFDKGVVSIRNRPVSKTLPPFTVKADGQGGGSKERVVPMPKPVADALAEWQVEAPENVPIVLLTERRFHTVVENWQRCSDGRTRQGGESLRPWENRDIVNNVLREIKRHVRRAGLTLTAPMTIHTLRKSFGQNHADNGTPIHVLQKFMGHSDITTTREFYLRVGDASEREATNLMTRLLGTPSAAVSPTKSDARMTPSRVEG